MAPRLPIARSETGDPLLLTPGPLTTAQAVKEVMVHDWGSRDAGFLEINRSVLQALPEIVNGGGDVRHRADAGFRHLRRRGDADDASCRGRATCWC